MDRRAAPALHCVAFVVTSGACFAQPPADGDLLVVNHEQGAVYAIDPKTGAVRGEVSGPNRGEGPDLRTPGSVHLLVTPQGRLLARPDAESGEFGLIEIDPDTGRRTPLANTDDPRWRSSGDAVRLDETTLLVAADRFCFGSPVVQLSPGDFIYEEECLDAAVLAYDTNTGRTRVVSGLGVGDGPLMNRVRAIALLDENTLIAVESGVTDAQAQIPLTARSRLVFAVDLATGDRRVLSTLGGTPVWRPARIDGEVREGEVLVIDEPVGDGPVVNESARTVRVVGGRVFVGFSAKLPDLSWNGGVIEIDPATGDRTLLIGAAYADERFEEVVERHPDGLPRLLDDVVGIDMLDEHTLVFACVWAPPAVFTYDLKTGAFEQLADLAAIGSTQDSDLTDLAVFRAR